jgi:drug/metabolite transporter (DMT)-like permease
LCVLASAACWATGSLLSRHLGLKLPHLTSACYQMIFGGLCQTLLGTCLGEWQKVNMPPSLRVVGAFTYLVIFGSLAGFVAFNWLLGHIPAAKVGTYAYVNPLIALGIGWWYGDTAIHLTLIAGGAIILGGVYLVRGDHRPYRVVELEPD